MWVTIGSGEGEGLSVRVEGDRFLVGSGEECQLMVRGEGVAPLHAYFQVREDGVVELHALEGDTYVNGQRLEGPAHITGGEEIRIGATVLRPSVDDPAEEARALQQDDTERDDDGPAVRVETEGTTVEVVTPDGEPVEVVPVRERRRIMRMSTRAFALAAGALVLGAVAIVAVLVLTGDDEKSTAEIVEDATPRTVLIKAATGQQSGNAGSGFVVDAGEGYVMTNFHVVNGGESIEVGVEEDSRTAELVAAAPCDDLALLKLGETDGLEEFELGSQDDLEQGDEVVALGYPINASLQDELTSTSGTVSVVKTSFNVPDPAAAPLDNVVQIDVALSSGNSGGPLVDKEGRLVGVNTAILDEEIEGARATGQGYAIGVDRVKEVLEELTDERSIGWAGLSLQPVPKKELQKRRLPDGLAAGLPAPGTDAEAQNLQEVLITEIDGNPVGTDVAGYCRAVDDVKSGQTVAMTIVDNPSGRASRPRQIRLKFE